MMMKRGPGRRREGKVFAVSLVAMYPANTYIEIQEDRHREGKRRRDKCTNRSIAAGQFHSQDQLHAAWKETRRSLKHKHCAICVWDVRDGESGQMLYRTRGKVINLKVSQDVK